MYRLCGHPLFLLFGLFLGFRRGKLEAIWRAVLARADRFPGARAALEVAEGLRQLERLGDDALLLLVVADLGVAGQREVLPQGVALEAVVGHDTAEVGVAGEEDAKHVVHLALVPVGAVV